MCLSRYGWDDCKDKVKTLFCSSYEDRCGKAVMEMKSFGRATEFMAKVAPLQRNAARENVTRSKWAAQRQSPSAISTVAMTTCAMEPKSRWSAPSCC